MAILWDSLEQFQRQSRTILLFLHNKQRDRFGHLGYVQTKRDTDFRADTESYAVWCEHLSDMWLFTLEIGVTKLPPVSEIAPKLLFFVPMQKLCCIVWTTSIWYVTHDRGAALPRNRNRAEITVPIFEQKPFSVWFPCRRKSCPV